jgi:hypothetical protein
MITEDEKLWMRLEAWEDKRFDLPPAMQRFLLSPAEVIPSMSWETPVAAWENSAAFNCRRIETLYRGDDAFWRLVFAHLLLSYEERQSFSELDADNVGMQWLMERLVAKDAVRSFLRQSHGIKIGPADVNIVADRYGRLLPHGDWVRAADVVPALSVAGADGIAVAIAGHSDDVRNIGIDLACVDLSKDGSEQIDLRPEECDLLKSMLVTEDTHWPLRIWCAKVAAGRALGPASVCKPQDLVMRALETESGIVTLELSEKLAQALPRCNNKRFQVNTFREGDLVVASAIDTNGDRHEK